MSTLRSEDMGLYILSLEKGSAWEVMNSLGKLTCLQFIDSNAKEQVYHLPYSSVVYRCDEALKKIRYIEQLCDRYNKRIKYPSSIQAFLGTVEKQGEMDNMGSTALFEKIELTVNRAEEFLSHQQTEAEIAFSKYSFVVEQRYVIEKAADIIIGEKK